MMYVKKNKTTINQGGNIMMKFDRFKSGKLELEGKELEKRFKEPVGNVDVLNSTFWCPWDYDGEEFKFELAVENAKTDDGKSEPVLCFYVNGAGYWVGEVPQPSKEDNLGDVLETVLGLIMTSCFIYNIRTVYKTWEKTVEE